MNQRTCDTCKNSFMPTHGRQRYCAPGCKPSDYRMVKVTCDCCGTAFERAKREPRYAGTFCSYLCRDYAKHGPLSQQLPKDHWAIAWGATCEWLPKPSVPRFTSGSCTDCDSPFIAETNGSPISYCSETCAARASRRRRRAREHEATGAYRWSDVMRQYQRQGFRCAYCRATGGIPEPEHVIPLSRGGDFGMTNIVAACRACNGDKRDLTPLEWISDRARRKLPALPFSLEDQAFAHLVLTTPRKRVPVPTVA